ncbi:hypothetical protein MW887_009290 [Aspergillus wentii]|nr:hypothetical protein MW887_009290 [Aspergillus wentii]
MESAGGPPLYSSIPHNLQSTYQNNNFSLGYPQSFVEHQGKVSPSNDQSNSRGVSSSPTPGLEPGYSEGSDLNIVIEDPKSPNGYREKRMRTKKDAVKQKEESRLLKESGGACLWCYRKKKKCGPIHPCPLCTSTGRRCIRESSQLSLLVPPAHGLPSGETSQNAEGRVFQLATEVLCRLKIKAFQTTDDSRVVVNIRQPNTDLGIWVAEMSQLGITPSNGLNRELVFKLLDHVCSPEMDDIEARFPGHQLIKSASTMARLFAALSSFSKTQVYIRPADVDPGRMTMFYILTTFAQALCEMSNEFCSELTEAMRRKETQDNNPGIIGYSPSPKSPNPVWVAAGLYYRVIKGLLSFKPGPPIANIFDDIKPHLDEVHAHMWSVLRFFPFGQSSNTKASVKEALKNHVPNVSGLRCSDIAFWLDWREEVPPPTALHRQTDPYSGTSYDMESFLNEDFTLPTFLPGSGCDSTGDSQSPPQMSELLSPGDSEAASSSRASIQSLPHELDTLYEDLLDPLGTNGWDSTMAIDAFYRDATWDHGQCDQASTRVGFNPFNDVPLLS